MKNTVNAAAGQGPEDGEGVSLSKEQKSSEQAVHKAVIASAMGNCIEWFDFGVFSAGVMTAIIGTVFFPEGASGSASLRSFALIAAAFLARPFGGLFFGPLGDKLGRKRVLAATIILMSGSTFVIGILPGYGTIGIAAPLLLLAVRLVQGFSTGGEYGGAATMIAEYSPTHRRGFFGSYLELGTLSGYILGAGLVLAMDLALSEEAMNGWGWRVPFLIALPLGAVGLYVRTRIEDTPVFQHMEQEGKKAQSPLKETLARYWRMILMLIGIVFLLNVADYTLLTFMPSYLVDFLDMNDTTAQLITIGVEAAMIVVILPLGALSDRIGRRPLLITAAVGYLLLSWPAFALMQTHSAFGVAAGYAIVGGLLVLILAVIGATFPAMFPTRVRYGAFAIGYNISTSLFGGTAAVLIGSLIDVTGSNYIPAYYLMIAALVALVPILKIPETAGVPIEETGNERAPEPAGSGAR
ncbi:MFS transporter [Actinomadura madurae]|uniref:MFS transporter n=2 Tax=Actinomadura madurae TaxID=1993 RepID=UPI00202723E1|nr:MFS transporter [Actinomadura madurae]MCP9953781.1 MFS transporter [Actinomadura madurae]MCP9970534.1 MFS transporter [Actinomadura madurae]MCP9983009.1 MFS transporter [Actinomadura madurae]URM99262.1 MFS transporter [Actinomadura madurae]URN09942.1 MFS transporter [Actinomadura madurae]